MLEVFGQSFNHHNTLALMSSKCWPKVFSPVSIKFNSIKGFRRKNYMHWIEKWGILYGMLCYVIFKKYKTLAVFT